ncbi:MAG: ribbon-helix-helix domain-containing protein [Rhodospirillales bacterium]|nr:ribbon-helix-helix domain-containing protein [Rhodospirillales bacterium]
MTEVKKRSVLVAGHATSVSLEAPFWDELKIIAERRGVSLNQLITDIDQGRGGNLSSALRVFVLEELRAVIGTSSES